MGQRKRIICLLAALGAVTACKREGAAAEPPATSAAAGKDAGDAPDKPAPIAGAYLTSVIVKPSRPDVMDMCAQLRSKDGRRYIDANVNKGAWSFVPPAGVPPAAYKVSLTRLTNKHQRYWCHASVKVQLTKAAGLALTGSANDPTMLQIARNMNLVFEPPSGKALKGATPYQATIEAQNRNSPYATPAAIVQRPDGASTTLTGGLAGAATALGPIVTPPAAQAQPLNALPPTAATQDAGPSPIDFANWTPAPPQPPSSTGADEFGSLFTSTYPADVSVQSATDPTLGSDTPAAAPAEAPGATGLVDCRMAPPAAPPTPTDLDSVRLLPQTVSPDVEVNFKGVLQSRDKCPDATPQEISQAGGVITNPDGDFTGCPWPCNFPAKPQAP